MSLLDQAITAGPGATVYPKVLLYGQTGTGKTITALTVAHMIGRKLLVIDGDQGTAAYSVDPTWAGTFDRIECSDPVETCVILDELLNDPRDYGICLVDSVSTMSRHAKYGVEAAMRVKRRGPKLSIYESAFSLAGWDPTKRLNFGMFDNMKRLRMPVICTARETGKWANDRIIGTKPETDVQAEHEFDVVIQLEHPNALGPRIATVTKDRLTKLPISFEGQPNDPFFCAKQLIEVYGDLFRTAAESNPRASNEQINALYGIQGELIGNGMTLPAVHDWLFESFQVRRFEDLSPTSASQVQESFEAQLQQLQGDQKDEA